MTSGNMKHPADKSIIRCWQKNVQPWIRAIRDNEIETRSLVTNQAIIDAIREQSPASVLDVGCGEGWLVRELENAGISSLGIDAVPAFIDYARSHGVGRYLCLGMENISRRMVKQSFDVLVCNFSLLGDEPVERLFKQAAELLNASGRLIVQTLHPQTAGTEQNCADGWRQGSWQGFNEQFRDPAPWYFRTRESWQALFENNRFQLYKTIEPVHPETRRPVSMIFIGTLR